MRAKSQAAPGCLSGPRRPDAPTPPRRGGKRHTSMSACDRHPPAAPCPRGRDGSTPRRGRRRVNIEAYTMRAGGRWLRPSASPAASRAGVVVTRAASGPSVRDPGLESRPRGRSFTPLPAGPRPAALVGRVLRLQRVQAGVARALHAAGLVGARGHDKHLGPRQRSRDPSPPAPGPPRPSAPPAARPCRPVPRPARGGPWGRRTRSRPTFQ